MHRSSLFFALHRFLVLTFVTLSAFASARAAEQRPNIIVILADDLGWTDVGHESSRIDTPNLDRLEREGVKHTRFYASAPMCSPTRAALLTGRYPHSVGMPELSSPVQRGPVPPLALDHDATTLPEALKASGYRNIIVGKWHLGANPEDQPLTHGFDEFWGSLIGTPGFWQPKSTYHNEAPIEVAGTHFTDALTERAVNYVRETHAQKQPLFLYLAYNAPHYPLEAPASLVYKYRQRYPKDGLFAIYAAMIEQMDAGIGRVLATLDELGMTENTIVIFTSDNGPSAEFRSYGPAGADISNGPLRGYKFGVTEGGIRVPFIVRWPKNLPHGKVLSETAITMDIMPTLLEAAQTPHPRPQEMHGRSLLGLWRGESFRRDASLHWENKENAAVLLDDWKLVHRYWLKAPQLYRIDQDPGETRDLAAEFPEKVAQLLALHDRWKEKNYPNPIPRQTALSRYAFPEEPEPAENLRAP